MPCLQVCGGPALRLFRSDELELLICGLPELNFEDLQSVARYDGGYNQEHPTIKAFWECLVNFTLDQKKLFLKFTTGCDRSVLRTLDRLAISLQFLNAYETISVRLSRSQSWQDSKLCGTVLKTYAGASSCFQRQGLIILASLVTRVSSRHNVQSM